MQIEAAVTKEEGAPFQIEHVELEEPRDDEVLVRVVGVGICHTDLIVRDQIYPTPCRQCSGTRVLESSRRWVKT